MTAGASFYLFAVIALVAALALHPHAQSPVAAALWLVNTMFSLAALYVLLDAQFIGAIQVLVYAGAIMVVFLFVVMLLNLGHAASDLRGPAAVAAAVVIAGLLVIELVALWRYSPSASRAEVAQAPQMREPATLFAGGERPAADASTASSAPIARPLFQTTWCRSSSPRILLLAAIVGAVVLAKRRI